MILMIMSLMLSFYMTLTETPMIMWILMEINNMMFIMLFILMQKSFNSPALMLLVQFFSSSFILISIIESSNTIMSLGILMKLGMAPAHTWMPMVIFMSPWNLIMLIMTLPKMPPFILMELMSNYNMIFLFTIISSIILTIKLMQTNNNKIIMAYSSIIHSGWMILAQNMSFKIWWVYFMLYSFNTFMMCMIMSKNSFNLSNKNMLTKIIMLTLLFSMMGMPPMTMFLGKLYLTNMTINMLTLTLLVLMLSSMVSMIYYSRMFNQLLFLYKSQVKIYMKSPKFIKTKIIIMMMILMVII